jgi:exodeoxyribonuclease-3
LKIATYNVNSIRMRLAVVLGWLSAQKPDILCLQETKVQDSEFPKDAFAGTGYYVHFRGMKAYNGVAILSRREPTQVTYGLADHPEKTAQLTGKSYVEADETRFCHAVFDKIHILNSYVPQGYQIDSPKYAYKLEWFKRLRHYFDSHFTGHQPVLWCGDLNVAPRDMDVHSPEKHRNHVCFHEDVRKAYQEAVAWGFEDVFVRLYPQKTQFTFFDYRKFPPPGGEGRWLTALETNKGWRIDHLLATPALAAECRAVEVDLEPRKAAQSSDHTFLWGEFDLS